MILLIDVGNSNICLGLYDMHQIVSTYRIKSFLDKSSDEYYLIFKNLIHEVIDDVIISSVVPPITSALKKMIEKYYQINPLIIGQKLKTGLKIIADDAKTVGADLICDVIGADLYYPEGLVIDLGTASKVLYYKDKTFLGCIIAPGVAVSTKAMIKNAALLPNMELITPKKILNTSTIPCMQAGVLYGFAGMVDGFIKKVKQEIKNDSLPVIATGGLISLIAPLCEEKIDRIEPDLVLYGLSEIYKKNVK